MSALHVACMCVSECVCEMCCGLSSVFQEAVNDVYWQREDDGGVLLGSDGVEGLQVTQLQGRRRLCDHQGGLLQRPRRFHLALCRDHLEQEQSRKWKRVWLASLRGALTVMDLRERLTLALASRLASASAAMALWSCCGSLTSLISTRSTLMPQSSVASSRLL